MIFLGPEADEVVFYLGWEIAVVIYGRTVEIATTQQWVRLNVPDILLGACRVISYYISHFSTNP